AEKIVGEIRTPQGTVSNPRLGKRPVEVEHAHQAGPLAAPIGYRKDRSTMGSQPGQYVMGVLPYTLRNNQRCIGRYTFEYLNTHALGVDKPMLLYRIVGVCPPHGPTRCLDGSN